MEINRNQTYLEHGLDLASNDFSDHIANGFDFAARLEQETAGSCLKILAEFYRPWFDFIKLEVLQGSTENYDKTTIQIMIFLFAPMMTVEADGDFYLH